MNINKIVFASNNINKFHELKKLFIGFKVNFFMQNNFNVSKIKENKLTFIENAIVKARHASKIIGCASISDDSGLTIESLNNKPGIYSSRFAGKNSNSEKNIIKVLSKIKYIPDNQLHAKLHCVLVFLKHYKDPLPIISYGNCKGTIKRIPIGNNGFGYDKIFYVKKLKKTLAQMTQEEKNIISHRSKAFKQLLKIIKNE